MKLKPMVERAKAATDLDFNNEIRPTKEQLVSHNHQLLVHIVRILTTYSEPFESYAEHPELQHQPRCIIPASYKTEQYPI